MPADVALGSDALVHELSQIEALGSILDIRLLLLVKLLHGHPIRRFLRRLVIHRCAAKVAFIKLGHLRRCNIILRYLVWSQVKFVSNETWFVIDTSGLFEVDAGLLRNTLLQTVLALFLFFQDVLLGRWRLGLVFRILASLNVPFGGDHVELPATVGTWHH